MHLTNFLALLIAVTVSHLQCVAFASNIVTENVFIPESCENTAIPDDHVLFKYELEFSDRSLGLDGFKNGEFELEHVILFDEAKLVVHQGLKSMCPNYIRKLTLKNTKDMDLYPILEHHSDKLAANHDMILTLTVTHVTTPLDYEIFPALKAGNASYVAQLIEAHKGINARDENAATSLMIATQQGALPIVASLLNTRMPKVNVNLAKPTGFTALFYAVTNPKPTILQALLRRGADPNVALVQHDGRGNTPLHFACLWEKASFVELLLQYGANPRVVNADGLNPLQLIPAEAVAATKAQIGKAFKEAAKKYDSGTGERAAPGTVKFRPEL